VASWTRLALVALLAGCGDDPPAGKTTPPTDDTAVVEVCDESIVDYDNFGQGFMATWCTPCHSGALNTSDTGDGDPRAGAPEGVNFDAHADVLLWTDRILARATGASPTMPVGGGPEAEDLALLEEWLNCGAAEVID
jgi:hypothetical protein